MDAASRDVLERLRQGSATRAADVQSQVRPPATAAARLGAPLQPGDRVFDTITGELATVKAPARGSAGFLAEWIIAYSDGGEATRRASQLIARPAPPAGRTP